MSRSLCFVIAASLSVLIGASGGGIQSLTDWDLAIYSRKQLSSAQSAGGRIVAEFQRDSSTVIVMLIDHRVRSFPQASLLVLQGNDKLGYTARLKYRMMLVNDVVATLEGGHGDIMVVNEKRAGKIGEELLRVRL